MNQNASPRLALASLGRRGRLALFLAGVALSVGAWKATFPQLELLLDIRNKVIENYVEEVDESYMDEGAVRGLIVYTDPYNTLLRKHDRYPYAPPADHTVQAGFSLGIQYRTLTVVSVVPGSPASRVGLTPGDKVLEFNSNNIFDKHYSVYEAGMFNFGKPGETLKLQVFRESEELFKEVTLAYADLGSRPRVSVHAPDPDTTVLRVASLADFNAVAEVKTHLTEIAGKAPKRVVLDLRECADGQIETGVALADLFLTDGPPLGFTRSYQPKALKTFMAQDGVDFSKLPLTVLVDLGTAEAAEVAAGILKAVGQRTLAGEKTFGKVTHMREVEFDSQGRRLLVLHATFYLPGEEQPIHEHGVIPATYVASKVPTLHANLEEAAAAEKEGGMTGLLKVLGTGTAPTPGKDEQLDGLLAILRGEITPAPVPPTATPVEALDEE